MQRDDATLLDIDRFCQQILVLTVGMDREIPNLLENLSPLLPSEELGN